ncbi:MAG TPA: hypothetical protein VGH42_11075 [Verrucomicrobiae bacterium]|jgi:hypothetical protein
MIDQDTRANFDTVLVTAIHVSQALEKLPTDRVGEIASHLVTQNVVTGLSISLLIHPLQRTGIPGLPATFTVTDLPSLCILTRGVVETYLTLFYLAIQPISIAEREFRLLWWDWHEVNERIWSLSRIGSKAKGLETFRKKRSELRPSITKHPNYSCLPDRLMQEFEQKRPPSDAVLMKKAEIAEAAGIHPDQFRVLYKSLSQYAHAQPVAVSTLLSLSATSPEIELHFGLAARYATSYLLFSVRDLIKIFPQGRNFTDEKFWKLVAIWSAVHKADLAKVQR